MTKQEYQTVRDDLREAKEKAIEQNNLRLEREMEKVIKLRDEQKAIHEHEKEAREEQTQRAEKER